MINSIDHILIAVKDLENSIQEFTTVFGFEPAWRSNHPSLGTENALFLLENTYLELISIKEEGSFSEIISQHLEDKGEGIFGIALGVKDIEMIKEKLSKKIGEDLKILTGKGINNITQDERHWKNIFIPRNITRGVFTLLIEHTKGSLPEYKEQENSLINRLDHIVINSNDPDGLIDLYRDKYEIRLALDQFIEQWGGRMLFFRTNHTTIEAIGIKKDGSPEDSLWGLAWTTKDIKKAHKRLLDAGVSITDVKDGRKPNTLVATIKSHTSNIPTLLIQHL
mgnify:FL=1